MNLLKVVLILKIFIKLLKWNNFIIKSYFFYFLFYSKQLKGDSMKWKQLFNKLKKFLLYEVNIDLRTTNLLLDILIESVSTTNYERFKADFDYLTNFTNTQTTLEAHLEKIKYQKLQKNLEILKNGDKNKPK